jgi:hypothetical protein
VTVSDGKGGPPGKAPPAPAGAGPTGSAQAASAPPAIGEGASAASAKPADWVAEPGFRHWRLVASAFDLFTVVGPSADLAYEFNREFGLNAFAAWLPSRDFLGSVNSPGGNVFLGFEMEVTPVHIAVGRISDLIDLGGMLGVSTINPDDGNWVAPHLGARMNVNLGERWAVTTTARFNASMAVVEAGLAFRL